MSTDIVDRIASKDISRNKRSLSGTEQFWLTFKYIALCFLTLVAIAPIYIMVVNSFKGVTGVSQSAAWAFPLHPNFAAWGPVWENLRGSIGRTLFFVVQSSIIKYRATTAPQCRSKDAGTYGEGT
jgi:glucose/mannose transport system permease protein